MTNDVSVSKESFYRKMDVLLNVPKGSVGGSQELRTLKSWDSLTILEFIVLADEQYQSNVQPGDIADCKTVDDLAELTFKNSSLAH